jgi:hypothetical protein
MSVLSVRCIRAVRDADLVVFCIASASILSVSAFECGAPLAPCGKSIRAGTTCPKGAGWCTAGHYCGYTGGSSEAQCVPLPKNLWGSDCGTAGSVCCPSNTQTPHTSETPPLERAPLQNFAQTAARACSMLRDAPRLQTFVRCAVHSQSIAPLCTV